MTVDELSAPADVGGDRRPARPPRLPTVAIWLMGLSVLVGIAITVAALTRSQGPAERHIVIPAGTAQRISAGEQVDLVEREVRLRTGDSLVVENHDVATHTVGPFVVKAGETFRQRFPNPVRYSGGCSLHPDKEVTVVVT